MTQIIGRGIQIFNGTGGGGGGAGVVAAANGLSIENRVGVLTAVLGGSLDEPTTIDLAGNELIIVDSSDPDNQILIQVNDGALLILCQDVAGNESNFTFQNGTFAILNSLVDNSISTIEVSQDKSGSPKSTVSFGVVNGVSSLRKRLIADDDTVIGIEVSDTIDSVGLIGEDLFPESDPNQYAQYGNLNNQPVNQFLAELVNGSGIVSTFNTPATGNTLYALNFALFSNTFSIGAVTTVTLDYTDSDGNPQTITLVNDTIGNPISINLNFIAAPISSVILSYSVTDTGGGNVATIAGQFQQQQNFT